MVPWQEKKAKKALWQYIGITGSDLFDPLKIIRGALEPDHLVVFERFIGDFKLRIEYRYATF